MTAQARGMIAAVVAALVVAGAPGLLSGDGTRFSPCPGGGGAACARAGSGASAHEVRIAPVPGAGRVGLPDRLLAVVGAPAEGAPAVVGLPVLRVSPAERLIDALAELDRRSAVLAGGAQASVALAAARASARVDGVILVDPPRGVAPEGRPLPVSLLWVSRRLPPRAARGLSERLLVLLRRPGPTNDCTRRVLAGFSRDPLSERPGVTDCR